MSTINPYASPQATTDSAPPAALGKMEGLWSDGPWLVVRRGATLPDVCVKTNQPPTQRMHYCFVTGWLLSVPLSEQARQRRVRRVPRGLYALVLGWFIACFGGALAVAILLPGRDRISHFLGVAGMLGFVPLLVDALVVGWRPLEVVRLVKTEGDYLWLSGVNPSYLAALPPWPPQDGPQSALPTPAQDSTHR